MLPPGGPRRPAPRPPAAAGPRRGRTGARRASRADWPGGRVKARAGSARGCARPRSGRSASTSAAAQSRSIVVVAGRMSSFDCAWGASSRSCSTSSRAAPPEKDRKPYRRRSSASTTTSPPASATTGRASTTACEPCGRATCSSSGSSTGSAGTSRTWSTPCRICRPAAWACEVLAGQGAQIDTTTAGGPPRVRHLRGAGRVRAGADPGTHRGRAQGRTGPRAQGWEEVRADESSGAAGPGRMARRPTDCPF